MVTFHILLRSSLGNWRFRVSLDRATKEALRKSLCHLLQDFGYVSVPRAVSKRLMDLANHCIACREGKVSLAPASLLSYVPLTATPRNRSHRPPFPSPRSRSVTGKSPVCLAEPSPSPKRFRYWCPKQSLPTRTGVLIQRATWRPDDRGLICVTLVTWSRVKQTDMMTYQNKILSVRKASCAAMATEDAGEPGPRPVTNHLATCHYPVTSGESPRHEKRFFRRTEVFANKSIDICWHGAETHLGNWFSLTHRWVPHR